MKLDNLTKNIILSPFNILYKISPRKDLEILFKLKQGYKLNLDSPKTYNEKLQWIKLNDKNPLMPACCDKYAVRAYVEKKNCGNILNRLIWHGDNPGDIPFEKLPEKFVIKVTHGSTFNIICTDKAKLDKDDVIKKCKKWLNAKFLPCYGEWFYGKIEPSIIVEEYLEDKESKHKDLVDYKVYCFNGRPTYIRMMSDRFSDLHESIYDAEWNLISGCNMGYPCSKEITSKPECLDALLDAASKLSEDFLHARVDFYIVNGKIYFGEITFTSGAGFDRFSSYDFDLKVGKELELK